MSSSDSQVQPPDPIPPDKRTGTDPRPPAPPPPSELKRTREPPAAPPPPSALRGIGAAPVEAPFVGGLIANPESALPAPVDPSTYYQRLIEASSIGDVCRDLIGERITTATPTELHVNCPRHVSQSGTSLHVSLETGLWYCFGCGVGGDVIQFAEFVGSGVVTKGAKGTLTPTHRAARIALAERASMPQLSSVGGGTEDQAYVDARGVFEAMTEIAQIYHERLASDEHAEVLEWLQSKYGITRETINRLRIGWSGGPVCFKEAVARGHDHEHVKASGFFRFGSFPEDIHSYFKNRIVFPYWKRGHMVYAIGRKTPWTEDNEYERAKYKKLALHNEKKRSFISKAITNPPLFGEDILHERPDAVILTEGITDAIAAQQAGFPTVSPVTVRFKKDEIKNTARLLGGISKVYLIQDNELSGAGLDGALDTAQALERHGTQCKIAELPLSEKCARARQEFEELLGPEGAEGYLVAQVSERSNHLNSLLADRPSDLERAKELVGDSKIDLCDYLRENPGLESIEHLLKRAVKPIEILIDRAEKLDDPDEQLAAIEPILVRIHRQKAPFRSEYLKRLKRRLGLPWGIAELKHVAKEAAGKLRATEAWKIKAQSGVIECNDNFLGDEFVREYGEDVRYCDQTGSWAIWDGTHWKRDLNLSIEHRARSTVERIGRIAEERAAAAAKAEDERDAKRLGGFAVRALSMNGVSVALAVAAGTGRLENAQPICLPLAGFDPYQETKHLLNCRNGVLDLRTRGLIPHEDSKHLHITKIADVEYHPDAACPLFLETLSQIFEGDCDPERAGRLIELLQFAVGYSLLGNQTHHLMFLLYGPEGRNGKSVLVRIFLAVLGSDYATTAPPGLLREKRSESHPTELADLHGRRFVAAVETGRGEKLNEALVKHLTGGDSIKARRMREDFWEFLPTHHIWIATNNLPRADAFDPALWARFRVIPFRRRFLKPGDDGFEESALACRADDTLADRILEQEREGVFAWMVEGCRMYLEAGGVPNPPESQEAVSEYRQQNDPIGEWIDEKCESAGTGPEDRLRLSDEWWTASAELYARYAGWSETRGSKPRSKNLFGRALTAKGFPADQAGVNRARGRRGIRMKKGPPAPAPPCITGGTP